MLIFEKLFFFIGLNLVRRYALNVSWKKLVLVGSCLTFFFNVSGITPYMLAYYRQQILFNLSPTYPLARFFQGLYFLIIFDVYRNAWFYIFTDVR
jgi:hypothetical protein